MMQAPTISVIFPVYNERADYLQLSLDSVLRQSFEDFELIVIDDSSLNETREILETYRKSDDRISVLRPVSRRNLATALNLGIESATGKYLARVDSDDIQEPQRFQRQVRTLEETPEIGVVGSSITKIDASGNAKGIRRYPLTHNAIQAQSCIKNPLCHASVTIRRDVLDRFGSYDPDFGKAEDYELWLRLIQRGISFSNLDEPLVRYRLANTVKRDNENWKFNLRAKARYFSTDHLSGRLLGFAMVGGYYLLPRLVKEPLYQLYNRIDGSRSK